MVRKKYKQILYPINLNSYKHNFDDEILEKYFSDFKIINFHWKSRLNKFLSFHTIVKYGLSEEYYNRCEVIL